MPRTFSFLAALAVLPVSPLPAQLPTLSSPRQLAVNGVPVLGRIAFGAISRTGETALADEANHVVYRFSATGSFRDSLGRTGSGPGEFRTVAGLAFGPRNEIAIADLSLRRVITWSESGKPLDATPIETGTPVALTEWLQAPVVAVTDFQGTLRFLAVVPKAAAREVARIPVGPQPAVDGHLGCDLCPSVSLADGHRLMAATRDSSYRLVEFDATGKFVRRWTSPSVTAGKRTEAEIDDLRRRMVRGPGPAGGSPEGTPSAPARERFRFPPRIVAVQRDSLGRIWALSNHSTLPRPQFDLFTAEGRFLGHVKIRVTLTDFRISGMQLLGWGESGDGESVAWVARIVR
jgi:hypothetical protein